MAGGQIALPKRDPAGHPRFAVMTQGIKCHRKIFVISESVTLRHQFFIFSYASETWARVQLKFEQEIQPWPLWRASTSCRHDTVTTLNFLFFQMF